jgi:predicted Fe-Mo cluster-binding NifX family protein
MKKIAMPVFDNKLSKHFETCSQFKFYYVKTGNILRNELVSFSDNYPMSISKWLIENGVTDVISAWINRENIRILTQNKVHVFVGVKIMEPEIIIMQYLDKILKTNGRFVE